MPFPETLEAKPKCIFFTDFDGLPSQARSTPKEIDEQFTDLKGAGTITLRDSNDWMTDNLGFGERLRKQGNKDVLEGKDTFRDSFRAMMDSVKTPFPECIQSLCANIKLDPYFNDFYKWSRDNGVPVIVLSSGMTPIIRALLVHLVGPEGNDIEIVSNEVADRPPKKKEEEGGWQIRFHDESGFGHDKSLTIRPYAKYFEQHPDEPRPTMFYAGDGVSDLSAARETDLLFAKKGHDLITYCEREGVPFTVFEDWQSILATTKAIFEGKTTVQQLAAESAEKAKK